MYFVDVDIVDISRTSVYMKLQYMNGNMITTYMYIKMSLGPSTSEHSADVVNICADELCLLPLCRAMHMERASSVVECRTRNQVSPGSNPPLLPFGRLGIFVLSIDAPVHLAV